jgi:hypothetical protein
MLSYFYQMMDATEDHLQEVVVFGRYLLSEQEMPVWSEADIPINIQSINVHSNSMEVSNSKVLVDFANKVFCI